MEVIFKENPIDINFMVITDYALLDTQNGYYVLADQGERVGMLCQPMTSYQKGKEVSFCTPSKNPGKSSGRRGISSLFSGNR